MKLSVNPFFLFFAGVLMLDLFFILLQREDLRWFSKPLLMPTLILAFYLFSALRKGRRFYFVLAALFLSWCGDVLLQADGLFIPGLLSFLLAHLFYILYFKTAGQQAKGWLQQQPMLLLPVLVYIGLLLFFLFPHLAELKVPVVIYSLTIATMLLMALNTRFRLATNTSKFFIAGALLFVLSDSLLAVNLFVLKRWEPGLGVMATYAAAQYLLVRGALQVANDTRRKSTNALTQDLK